MKPKLNKNRLAVLESEWVRFVAFVLATLALLVTGFQARAADPDPDPDSMHVEYLPRAKGHPAPQPEAISPPAPAQAAPAPEAVEAPPAEPAVSDMETQALPHVDDDVVSEDEHFQTTDEEPATPPEVGAELKDARVHQYALKNIKTFREDDAVVVQFQFDRPYEGDNLPVDFIHQTIQLNIPNASLKGQKKSTAVHDKAIVKVVTYQKDASHVRSQIVLRHGVSAKDMESRVQFAKDGNNLRIRLLNLKASLPGPKDNPLRPVQVPVVKPTAMDSDGPTENAGSLDEMLKSATLKIAAGTQDEAAPIRDKSQAVHAGMQDERARIQDESTPIQDKSASTSDEREIPLVTSSKSKTGESALFSRMLMALGIVSAVGIALLYAVRRYTHANHGKLEATKIKIITQHHLGPKKSLAIIRVAGESMLIGITDHNISMIKSLALLDEDLPDTLPHHFKNELSARDVVEPRDEFAERYFDQADEFSMAGINEIKHLVARR